jgi:hypothetical protein
MLKRSMIICLLGVVPVVCLAAMGTVPVAHHGAMVSPAAPAGACLACHGPEAALARKCDPATSHRSDRPYPANAGSGFAPAAIVVARGVPLPEGAITCISCHDLTSPAPLHLTAPMADSALCLVCHIL